MENMCKTKTVLAIFILGFLSAACIDKAPLIKFDRPDLFSTELAEEDGLEVRVRSYPIDEDIVFLYGELGDPGGAQQSLLLRSADGGQHWAEVLTPVKGNSVLDLFILKNGHGWAMVAWTMEGIDNITLYRTSDYGEHWQGLSKVPRWQWYGGPVKMVFRDEKNGQIDMVYAGGKPGTDRVAYLTTSDGGLTWAETRNLPLDANNMNSVLSAYWRPMPPYELKGYDDSSWKIDEEKDLVVISRRLAHENNWSVRSRLPRYLDFVDGQIAIPK